jgi:hypothetical protein
MFNAKTFDGFLSSEQCQYLIQTAVRSNLWESGGSEFWDNRTINYSKLIGFDRTAADIMLEANVRCKVAIKEAYGLDKDVYSDTLQVIRWFEGMSQPPHADDMSNTDIQGFDHRVFGSIIYLNADYLGGHTYYPNFGTEVVPAVGKLAVHPGDPEHLHGVTTIENGTRYTIASFWTFNKEKSHDWSVYK